MFSKMRKTTGRKTDTPPAHAPGEALARFAIAEDGQIVYANAQFYLLSSVQDKPGAALSAKSLLRFAEDPSKSFEDISAGNHPVFINGHKQPTSFHFDWLTAPDNKKYLIASEIETKKGDIAAEEMDDFAARVLQLVKTSPLETQQEDAAHLLALSRDILCVTGESGKLISANQAFEKLTGYSAADMAGKNFIDLFDDEDKPQVRSIVESLPSEKAQENSASDFEARLRGASGLVRAMEWHIERRGDKIYGIGRDIMAAKAKEATFKRRERQLAEAESIGHMGHWHWSVGQDDIEWSEEIYRIFGVSQDDFKPSLHQLDQMVYRRDIGRVIQAFQRAIIEKNDYDMEFRIKQPSGDIRFIHCEGRCEKDHEGEVIALFGIMQDMTERMLYERQLHEAKDSAERAYAAKTQFLANMSHELRTPLNAIIGFSEMMQRQLLGPIGTEKYLDYIGGIRESGEHLLDLISDILDMSKIEAGKYDLDLEEINVAKTVRLAAHMMQGRAEEAKVQIITDKITNEALNIIVDRRAFMQILLNLLSNAVKFTGEGGEIWLECLERKDYVSIKVSDNGIGIPANKLASITRPFEQVSTSYARDHEGSGLGLAITKELAELHGGTLLIESTINVGTTVTVRLPYKAKVKEEG